jgi:hypothetical protein
MVASLFVDIAAVRDLRRVIAVFLWEDRKVRASM